MSADTTHRCRHNSPDVREHNSQAQTQLTRCPRQGLRHTDENGGDGDQAAAKPGFSLYQKPKTQRIWPTIFLKMGGLSPALSKMGGRVPPVPPCGGAPGPRTQLTGADTTHQMSADTTHQMSADSITARIEGSRALKRNGEFICCTSLAGSQSQRSHYLL